MAAKSPKGSMPAKATDHKMIGSSPSGEHRRDTQSEHAMPAGGVEPGVGTMTIVGMSSAGSEMPAGPMGEAGGAGDMPSGGMDAIAATPRDMPAGGMDGPVADSDRFRPSGMQPGAARPDAF